MGYKFGDQVSKIWVPEIHESFPQEIIDHVLSDGTFEAHNVQFERAIWIHVLHKRYGVPVPTHWKDTLAVCAYRALPLGLDAAGKALNLKILKDGHGQYLLNTLCSPKGATKKEPDRVYREDFDLMMDLYDYCRQDCDAEYALGNAIGDLPPSEFSLWNLDQRINQRGVRVDLDAIDAALEIIEKTEIRLNEELQFLTEGAVQKASQRDRLLDWFRANGLPQMANMTKGTLEELTATDDAGNYINQLVRGINPTTMRVLDIRAQLAKASTAKFTKMQDTVCSDGRIRGLLQYHGASTGRWAGRLVQPQNFPRPTIKDMDTLVSDILKRDVDLLDTKYGGSMGAVSSSLRGMFIPDEGSIFRVCDFSAIEARVTFWVAGCQTGLDVFEKSDRGESEDIYCITASDLVGHEVKKDEHPHERQLGKITVLGCGYQMGGKRLKEQALVSYKVDLTDSEADNMVGLYRTKYKEVPNLWKKVQSSALYTVSTKKPTTVGHIRYEYVEDDAGPWLACVLPNGRRLWYYKPFIDNKKTPWGEMLPALHYSGRDNKTSGAWGIVQVYGGMLVENIVQAIARDIMVESMVRVEAAGYPIVLTVHDEIISEAPADFGSQEQFEGLMAQRTAWAPTCPIAVEGAELYRYQKA
jgi:DNA polymerase